MKGYEAVQRDLESGFSLAEILVAMVLLSITALAFFPVVAHSSQAAAGDTTLSVANRLVSEHMERVRATPLTTCPPAGAEPLGAVAETVTDARGVQLQAWTKFEGTCTPSGLARYVVTVTKSSAPSTPLATATTLIALESAP